MTTATQAIRDFYAVLDRDDEQLARALVGPGGARVLQVRLKPRSTNDRSLARPSGRESENLYNVEAAELVRVAGMARRICDEVGAALIVNDRVDVALAVDADGVHLGQTDLPIAAARTIAGVCLWIGVSTHDLDQVRAACSAGADYIGFGPIFHTTTKANPAPVQGLDGLRAVPVVAIGGITPERAAAIYETGAAAICAIGAVNDTPDVGERASKMRRQSHG